MCIYIIYIWEKYQDTPGSSSIRMPLEVPNLPNYPYVQKITLYKVFIQSNLQPLLTKDGRNGPKLALFTKDLSV